MRGEYSSSPITPVTRSELPPRARRILIISDNTSDAVGTTSACAENTRNGELPERLLQNYLRVRGEYAQVLTSMPLASELPPRARRIPANAHKTDTLFGTTSACAENTLNELGLL